MGAAVLGLSVLALVSAHLWLTPNRPSQGHLRGHQRVRKVPLEALVLKNEDHKEDLVVATTPLGRKTVVTENCIWHSCGNNTVCRLSALDGTDDGNRSANVTKTKGLAECRHLCEKTGEDCKGVEYNAETGRCEVWTQPIFSHRSCITGKDCPEAHYSCHTMQCKAIDQEVRLRSPERSFKDRFGRSVSISGDTVAVGAPGDNDRGDFSGAAYVFLRKADTFEEQAKLTADDGFRDSYFGQDVSIFGDTILVGADRDSLNGKKDSGSAYIFRRDIDVWQQEAKLTPKDALDFERFGARVSIMADRAVVVAAGNAEKNVSAALYIFHRHEKRGWVLKHRLLAPEVSNANFGSSLSQTNDTILIGAQEDNVRGPGSGSVILYTWNGSAWSKPSKLVAKETRAGDRFGCSVGMSGDMAIIGAFGHTNKWKGDGAAYIFKQKGGHWVEVAKLLAEDGDANDGFGRSVSMSSGIAAIGAAGDEHSGVDKSGSGYIFVRQGQKWVQQSKLSPSKVSAGARFGQAVSMSGHMASFSTASEHAFVFPASLTQVCRH